MRRVERAAEDARHCHSRTSSPISTSWPFRAPAALQRRLELLALGRVADDPEAAVGAVDPVGAPRRRLRPVLEEVRQLGASSSVGSGAAGQSAEQRALELVDARAGRARDAEDARRCARPRREAGGSGSRSILFRTTPAAARRARRRRARARGRSCGSAPRRRSSEASITCRSSRARSRWARNSWPSPMPSLAPSIRPGTSATVSWRAVRRLDRAEHRRERRERVVGDLRLRVREPAQQRRLARVRQPGERRVGEQLQPQLELGLLGGLGRSRRSAASAGSASRSARCRGRRCRRARATTRAPGVARSATSSPSTSNTCVPTGTASSIVAPSAPCLRAPRPGSPRPALNTVFAAERREVAQIRVGDEHDVAAAAAVAAVRAALRHVLLAPEAEAAVAAAARLHLDAGAIVEHARATTR